MLSYQIRQLLLFFFGTFYQIMSLTIPMGGGGISIIAEIFAPITFGVSLIMMLVQKVMHVFSKNKVGNQVLFYLFSSMILIFTFITFPFR
ncbi:MAG: hypothetical protein BM555_06085 [Crocinitomix sp. MedPE-SWsnd]|nr:MAG: hypothetical protein BM555_06085 [Crocinitomix sp. MedPE-SWsnd]